LVSKGRDECLIQVDRIECISAAGNYVDIYVGDQTYLMRATMKQVEGLLPPAKFVRVHRSHIANREQIDRIKTHASGNGSVHLRCGKAVSISKKYKQRLYSIDRASAPSTGDRPGQSA
jgi:DNA-binding LytR/AlgR family response regulator